MQTLGQEFFIIPLHIMGISLVFWLDQTLMCGHNNTFKKALHEEEKQQYIAFW